MATAKVAAGQVAQSSAFNGLVDDIWDKDAGHAHTGAVGGGQKVNHGNLVDGAIPHADGTPHTHAQIDDHIGSTTGTGSTGVHGLYSTAAVLGVLGGTQYTMAVGSATTTGSGRDLTAAVATGLTTVAGMIILPTNSLSAAMTYDVQGDVDKYWYVSSLAGGTANLTFHAQSVDWGGQVTFYWLAWGTMS